MNRKHFSKLILLPFLSLSLYAFASAAPSLSITNLGDGRNVQLNVHGDPNVSVNFFYTTAANSSQIKVLGNTDSSGNYTTTIDNTVYGITPNTIVYVALGGLSGTQSNQVLWPTLSSSGSNGLSLSQTNVNVSQAQNLNIFVNNYSGSQIVLSSNSNPAVAYANTSGNQITIYGQSYGTTVMNFCYSNNSSICSSVTVNVQSTGSQGLSFSQNNITLTYGSSQTTVVSGGSGSYYISNNSNSSLVSPSVSGNTIILNTFSTSGGTANITVCTNGNTYCGVLYVTTNGNGGYTSSSVTFSQNNPTVNIGQNTGITVYGPSTSFSITSVSNPNIVQANISGNILTLIGLSAGNATVNVCSPNNICTGLNVVVANGANSNNQLFMSQNNVSISSGQSTYVTISGSGPFYVSNNSNPSIASININGNAVTVTGNTSGYGTATICQSSNSQCGTINISVSGNSYSSPTITSGPYLQADLTLLIGQTVTLTSSNTSGTLTLSNNPNTTVANVIVNGNSVAITGLGFGTDNISVCQTGSSSCGTYNVTITNPNATVPPVPTNTYTSSNYSSNPIKFHSQLHSGSRGNEVYALQEYLKKIGLLEAVPNGFYGQSTRSAVIAFQKRNGITPTGILGPLTRSVLNK